ncbi:MAG: J domain-containing protein [Acidobacteriota bacterium]|nr:J domain-containing protein [Acidobacteriota bacterium]
MPKTLRIEGGRVRTLAIAKQTTVLTDLDAATFKVQRKVRALPLIHKLLLDPDGFSLGYTQRHAKGNPSELHFINPDLQLAGSLSPADGCTAFSYQKEQWIVACRDGGIHCFNRSGSFRWTWRVPVDRHFESPVFNVAASDDLIFIAQGLYLYALTPNGRVLWDWELPNRHEQTHRLALPIGTQRFFAGALKTLGLNEQAAPDDIRQAYRRMARLTHPDFNPCDPLAAERFRTIREAYDAAKNESSYSTPSPSAFEVTFSLMINGRPVTASISSLTVNGSFIALGTTEGEVYLCNHDAEVLSYHADLGRQGVYSMLLNNSGIQSAFCYPRLFRFDNGPVAASEPISEYSVQLVACGDDSLLWGWKTMWLFDRQAKVKASRILDRKIDGVASSASEAIVLSGGHLCSRSGHA